MTGPVACASGPDQLWSKQTMTAHDATALLASMGLLIALLATISV